MHDELLFERSGFKVTGSDDGVVFQTAGTIGLGADDAAELARVLSAWAAA